MGGHGPDGQHNTSDARFVACPGKAEGRNEAERPPALRAPPRPHSQRKRRTPPPPPSPPPSIRTPWTRPAARSPHRDRAGPPHPHARAHNADPDSPPSGRAVGGGGAQDPRRPTQRSKAPPRGRPTAAPITSSQVGGNRDRTAPPPKHARRSKGPRQDTRRGTDHVERPYQRPVPGPREMRAPHHPAGGGADTARARAHTHERDTRGLQEGQPDRARGRHRPHGMAYQRARVRDTRTGRPATRSAEHAGRGGGNERDTTPGAGPNPPEPAASAAHTQTGHCARQGSSGAQRHAPTPRLGSLRASPRGSHWQPASSTGPAAPAPRATTH